MGFLLLQEEAYFITVSLFLPVGSYFQPLGVSIAYHSYATKTWEFESNYGYILIFIYSTVLDLHHSSRVVTLVCSVFLNSCIFGGFLASAVCSDLRVNHRWCDCGFTVDAKGLSRPRPTLLLNNRLAPPPHPRVTSSDTAATTAAATAEHTRVDQGGETCWSINTRCCNGLGGFSFQDTGQEGLR